MVAVAHNASEWSPASATAPLTPEQCILDALGSMLALGGRSSLSLIGHPDVDVESLIRAWVDRNGEDLSVNACDSAYDGQWFRMVDVFLGDRRIVSFTTSITAPTPRETDRSLKAAMVGGAA